MVMESKPARESIVSRLFGFGRRKEEPAPEAEETAAPEESGFARTEESFQGDDGSVTIPEQVIRVKPVRRSGKDEAIGAISDSFRELTSLLGSVSDRLDRSDSRAVDLADQLKELPEYLRSLPRLHQEQNEALHDIGSHLASSHEAIRAAGQEQALALRELGERVAEGTSAVGGIADALSRLPDELKARAELQQEALREVATAQQQTAKVIYAGHKQSLQLFHQATQKTLRSVKEQREQMEDLLHASVTNMKRMFILAAAFMGAALIATVGLLLFR